MAGDKIPALDARDGVERAAKAWEQAMISNDASAIGQCMTDDWIIVSDSGVTTKSAFLAFVASGDLTHEMFQGETVSIRCYGDTAVLASRVRNAGRYKGEPFSADEWTTDVFVMRDGVWRCVHSQITAAKQDD